jgi:hypothetical protein
MEIQMVSSVEYMGIEFEIVSGVDVEIEFEVESEIELVRSTAVRPL